MILGIEFGSTRIKAVIINEKGKLICSSNYEWKDTLIDGYWSYSLEDIWKGLQMVYSSLKEEYIKTYGEKLKKIEYIGISAMMHGYLALDKDGNLLVPFRTWRNTNTSKAADILSEKLSFNMPQRWSASHYYQAILNKEEHVEKVDFLTTLAGYIHFKLTGEKVLGIGDASGMFPIKEEDYDEEKLQIFNNLLKEHNVNKDLKSLLPKVLKAGKIAGRLTKEGAKLLDVSGDLEEGAIFCPPEGDAQTGMVATNSIKVKTGNVSAGTSAFVMVVLEKALKNYYKEIDILATPCGNPVAMVHANNCTSEINAWVNLFNEVINLTGNKIDKGELFTKLFNISNDSDKDTGKIFACNFFSGEPVVGLNDGLPMVLRSKESNFNLANFMKAQVYSAVAPLYVGIKILEREDVVIEAMCGHGGYFKTPLIGQKAMSIALNAPITVYKNAGEGGAFGIALLALYLKNNNMTLEEFLNEQYANLNKSTIMADEKDKENFNKYMENYLKGLKVESKAVEVYDA